MAQCKGTTNSGSRCKLDAHPGSDFCHLHGKNKEKAPPQGEHAAEDTFELEDLVPLVLAGAMAAGFFILMKSVGRFFPRF